MVMQLTDAERENIIGELSRLTESGGSPSEKRYWWSLLQNMIHSRSAEQVRRMEEAKGLARKFRAA